MLMARQRGVALITAIFVVTLATIAAVAMVEMSNVSVHRSANLAQSEAEWWYASGIESWVKGILVADAKITGGQTVGLNGIWAKPVDFLPIDGGGIRGHIDDLQGRFNLNNLGITQPTAQNNGTGATVYTEQFERLIENLPNFDGSKFRGISLAIRDWIDADDQRAGTDGAEDQDYLSQDPPYRAANQGMHSVSELLLVRGMTRELYAALLPYVTALPTATSINVNTAPVPVLMSLSSNIDQSAMQRFIAARNNAPAKSKSDVTTGEFAFIKQPPQGQPQVQMVPLDITSNYFGLQAEVFVGSGRLALYSVFQRPNAGIPVVLAHSTNTQ